MVVYSLLTTDSISALLPNEIFLLHFEGTSNMMCITQAHHAQSSDWLQLLNGNNFQLFVLQGARAWQTLPVSKLGRVVRIIRRRKI